MATKKYLSLDRLTEYDALIKQEIADSISGKADSSHNHDELYYTETEIDTKLSAVNTSITNITSGTTVVKEAEHAGTADSAATATTATTATSANTANTANSATKATQDGNGKNIANTYETKVDAAAKLDEAKSYTDTAINELSQGFETVIYAMYGEDMPEETFISIRDIANDEATTALDSAKSYADSAATKVKNDLLNGAGGAYDTLKELGDLIVDNADAIEALETIASGKADAEHGHEIADVSGLQSALDGKAASSHGTHVTFDSTNKPKMDGTAAFGTSTNVARADHVHPTDTSRASKTEFDSHAADATAHITSTERENWEKAYTHSQAAHAPSNAQANVIESIKVNGTAQTITSKAVNITVPTKASDINAAAASHSHAISEITNLQTTLNNASSAIGANTSSITALTDRTAALEAKVGDGFTEITSAEIQALFN